MARGKFTDLTGQKFGSLTVIKQYNPDERIFDKNGKKMGPRWECLCDCGNSKILITNSLNNRKYCSELCSLAHKSAEEATLRRVWKSRYPEMELTDYFNFCQKDCAYCGLPPDLFMINQRQPHNKIYYNTVDRINCNLPHSKTNVVGCCKMCNRAKLDQSIENFEEQIYGLINRKIILPSEYRKLANEIDVSILYDSKNYAYKSTVKLTLCHYNDGDLTVDNFYQLTQLNCYYCGGFPQNKLNKFKTKSKQATQYARDTGNYYYNGLDRFDNNFPHNYDNVVPCCIFCNFAKADLSFEKVLSWIDRLRKNYPNMLSYFQSRGYLLNIKL